MPPVKPTRPSVTRIFRCVRMFIAIKCHRAKEGRKRACLTPSLAQGAENGGPGIPRARRVNQHAHLHAPAGGVTQRPREGQPDFVPVKDIGAERDGLAGLLNRLQHRRERLISVNERLDPVARQQRPLHHAAHHSRQHVQVPGVPWQMAVQFLRRTLRLLLVGAVPLEAAPQQDGLAANPVHAKDEVERRPDQGHQPDEAHPPDG